MEGKRNLINQSEEKLFPTSKAFFISSLPWLSALAQPTEGLNKKYAKYV